jgi:indole-3-glycerol phosphate synthase
MAHRRFSQAISEGDGISLIVEVADLDAARAAAAQGAEGVIVRRPIDGLRDAIELPILWRGQGRPSDAAAGGADAWALRVTDDDDDGDALAAEHADAEELGLDCVVEVRTERELELALERLDPEIFLLSSSGADEDEEPLDRVLSLLPGVPAGKLAIAEAPAATREDVLALERAGIDGVLVDAVDVADLVGGESPAV